MPNGCHFDFLFLSFQTRGGEATGDGPVGGAQEEGDGATVARKASRRRATPDAGNRFAAGSLQRVSLAEFFGYGWIGRSGDRSLKVGRNN